MDRASTKKSKRTASRWVGTAERWVCQGKTHTLAAEIRSGEELQRMNLFPEKQVIQPPHWAPKPLDPALERPASETPGFENQEETCPEKLFKCSKRKIHS